jgi:hypothetical protein
LFLTLLPFTWLYPALTSQDWNNSFRLSVIIFPPALASWFSADHYPKFRVLRLFQIGCCVPAVVTNSFPAVSLLSQADSEVFGLLTGFCVDSVIADIFSASPFPINQDGMLSSFP